MPLFLISLVWPLPRRVSLPTLREGLDDGAIDQDLLGLPGHKVRQDGNLASGRSRVHGTFSSAISRFVTVTSIV